MSSIFHHDNLNEPPTNENGEILTNQRLLRLYTYGRYNEFRRGMEPRMLHSAEKSTNLNYWVSIALDWLTGLLLLTNLI